MKTAKKRGRPPSKPAKIDMELVETCQPVPVQMPSMTEEAIAVQQVFKTTKQLAEQLPNVAWVQHVSSQKGAMPNQELVPYLANQRERHSNSEPLLSGQALSIETTRNAGQVLSEELGSEPTISRTIHDDSSTTTKSARSKRFSNYSRFRV